MQYAQLHEQCKATHSKLLLSHMDREQKVPSKSGPESILLMRWPLFHCHCSHTQRGGSCGFDASGRVSTNAEGRS